MKTNVLQLHNVSPEEFKNEILTGIKTQLDNLKNNLENSKKSEYLTRKEASILLGVSLVTIHVWCKKDILKPYKIGNRIRFKREEIEATLENS
ncbi:helix-turn-helix domain-containing protein [Costertonia aggregata]|uniref:Helix-turn-helix domain-containing protein n=1 Tax=Costertonia aggregata TaxID=343403 RepID=A0A7H9AMS3_9FLAO|nr:helix-turn-helix domain-containing protein [Costertonia aggregata]QLG44585.1 helix-turn-helix domain-containing protein [Costertonia aggregata]